MNNRPDTSKLVELRSKTDRQLVQLITRKLDRAACLASVDQLQGPAERVYDEVRRLLPLVSRSDRRRLEARVQELAAVLHCRAQAACF
jgi:hypothetical protein